VDQKRSYYQLLELESSADSAKIKAAYRRLARKYHPDINPGNPQSEAMFKRIGEAYAVLSDPQKRAVYDQSQGLNRSGRPGANRKTETQTSAGSRTHSQGNEKTSRTKPPPRSKTTSTGAQGRAASAGDVQGAKFREMFDALFKKAEKPSEAPPPSRQTYTPPPSSAEKGPASKPKRGEDVTVEAFISREEAESGVVKTVNVQHTELCKRCSGTGKVNGVLCTVCHGDKQLVTLRKIDVRVPAGVKGGSKVRVAKEGGRGLFGGDPGDLFLVIRIEEEQSLKIEGLTVSCEVPISITEAVLGAEIEVPTIHGKVKMVIPPQTSSGRVFRLKGQGVTLNGNSGDQYVTVQIVAPKNLSSRERELYQELSRIQKDSPRK
jgi:molecular chaperone DnaJ